MFPLDLENDIQFEVIHNHSFIRRRVFITRSQARE